MLIASFERRVATLPQGVRPYLAAVLIALYALSTLYFRFTPWHDALVLPGVLWAAMASIDRLRRRGVFLAALSVATLAIALVYVHTTGFAGRNEVFASIFPLSDAGEYYWDAERVLHGATMEGGGARRPIFSAALAGLLRLCGNDMPVAHALTMLLWAGAGAFAVNEVRKTHGRKVATVLLILFVWFARRYVGFVQSEGLGGPLGAIAFGLFWRAQSLKDGWQTTYIGGLLLQALALLARPGPLFVLVALIAWAVSRSESARRLHILAASVGVIAAVLGFQTLIRATTTNSPSYSDLPPILYGLVHNQDYNFVVKQYPWVPDLPPARRAGAIWGILFHELRGEPLLFAIAPFRGLASWFYRPEGFFGMVWHNPDDRALENAAAVTQAIANDGYVGPVLLWVRMLGLYSLINAIAMAAAAAAFYVALVRAGIRGWANRRALGGSFLAFAAVGILASIPFTPTWITEGTHIVASTYAYVVAGALTAFAGPRLHLEARSARRTGPVVAAALGAIVLVGKLFPVLPPKPACDAAGRYLADIDLASVVDYGSPRPKRSVDDVQENLAMLERNHARKFAATLEEALIREPGEHRIFPAYDSCHQRPVYIVERSHGADRQARWAWLDTAPMREEPLEESLDADVP
jgi:hypothetical protein